jgi:hypothetical protein
MVDKKMKGHLTADDPPAKKRQKNVSQESTTASQVGREENGSGEELVSLRHMNSKAARKMNPLGLKELTELFSRHSDPDERIILGTEAKRVKITAESAPHTVFDEDSADKPKVGFGQGESNAEAISVESPALEINQNDNLSWDRQIPKKADRVIKQRLTIHVPVNLIDRIKNAVYYTPGLTMSDFADTAFEKAISLLEEHNGGPFQQRTQELKGGRPIK